MMLPSPKKPLIIGLLNLNGFRDHLILITSPEDFADEHILIERMFEQGLSKLHVRKLVALRDLDYWLLGLGLDYRKRCVLHSDFNTAIDLEVGGVHTKPLLPNDPILNRKPANFLLVLLATLLMK